MKTLKFFMVPCVLTLFAVSTVNAQPKNKDFGEMTIPLSSIAFCGTEVVTGTITIEWKVTVPDEWFQQKVYYSLVGKESGGHYEGKSIFNVHYRINPNGVQYENYTRHSFIKRDNVPLGYVHENFHYTVNANGDLTVNLYNWIFECFENR
jgi:hypothetical protein